MNVIELKSDLHHLIDKINDKNILNAVRTILSKQTEKTDWADLLNDDLRIELEASISEADKGNVISHEEAMQQIKSRYKL